MLNQLILHIPHSSPNIPFRDGFVNDDKILESELLKLTDWYTDDLYGNDTDIIVKADFSRIFCDVERFSDDKDEIMALSGMGVLYTKTDSGKPLRKVTKEMRDKILNDFYFPHHKKLSDAVKKQLGKYQVALIIDCHSFPDKPFERDLNKEIPRPDFSIGTDLFHTPSKLTETALNFFRDKGFIIHEDKPYKGTMVPMEYFNKNKNVWSLMLEVNRKLYLKENSNEKSENYREIKETIKDFLGVMRGITTIKEAF